MTKDCIACFENGRTPGAYPHGKACREYLAQRVWTNRVMRLLAADGQTHVPAPPDYTKPHTAWVTPGTDAHNSKGCRPNPWATEVYRLLRRGA
ncbi:MAG: hypothetical protein HW395_36 [candidate division NC10 bacterium]|nr:hypothetical protein [candidate division NC10 bacterium]